MVVSVAGEIDAGTEWALRDVLTAVLARGIRRVVVDLAGVAFLASSGIGVLMGARKVLAAEGGSLVLAAPRGEVAQVLSLTALGVTVDGERDVLGLWAGEHGDGEGAKFWLRVLSEIKNRGTRDVCMLVCDGLKGLPEVVGNAWPAAIVQTCIVHLIRNTFHLASKRDWDALRRDVKPIYTAVNAEAARAALDGLAETWGQQYGAIIRLWENAWQEFIPFLDYDVEIRKVLCSTNAIESLNARYRRAVKARGHFPTEQAALKCLYLVTRSLDPTGTGRTRWAMRWKPALNAFAITFGDRFPAAETY